MLAVQPGGRHVRRLGRRLPERPAAEHRAQRLRFDANVVVPFPRPLSAAQLPRGAGRDGPGRGRGLGRRRRRRPAALAHRSAATPDHRDDRARLPARRGRGRRAAGSGSRTSSATGSSRIDPATNRVVGAIPVGRGAIGVTVGAGSVWVAGAIEHAVTRIDPATSRVVGDDPRRRPARGPWRSVEGRSGWSAMRARAGLASSPPLALVASAAAAARSPSRSGSASSPTASGRSAALHELNVADGRAAAAGTRRRSCAGSSRRAASTGVGVAGRPVELRSAASRETTT